MTNWTNEELGKAVREMVASTTIAKTKTFDLRMADFPINAIVTMLAHGAQRKFNDAVGGADKTPEVKVALAEAMIAEYKEGVVSKRRESTAVEPEVRIGRKIMRGLVPQLLDKAGVAKFRAMDADEQNAKLDGWIAANAEVITPMVVEELAKERAKGKLAAKVALAI